MTGIFVSRLLEKQAELELSDAEVVLILNLASFDWPDKEGKCKAWVQPSVPTLAKRMGRTARRIRTLLSGLDGRLLNRIPKLGKATTYDLLPLYEQFGLADTVTFPRNFDPGNILPGVKKTSVPPRKDSSPEVHEVEEQQLSPPEPPDSDPADSEGSVVVGDKNSVSENSPLDLVDALEQAGVDPKVAEELTQSCKADQIRRAIRFAEDPESQSHHPAGWVVRALREGWTIGENGPSVVSRYTPEQKARAQAARLTPEKQAAFLSKPLTGRIFIPDGGFLFDQNSGAFGRPLPIRKCNQQDAHNHKDGRSLWTATAATERNRPRRQRWRNIASAVTT